tara:strand:+ start:7641 stop:7793 length:153 start_codon:yes stop_codon:yes gene_type:complete
MNVNDSDGASFDVTRGAKKHSPKVTKISTINGLMNPFHTRIYSFGFRLMN